MEKPATISVFSRTYVQVKDIRQFRYTTGPDKGRRREGLKYYILYQEGTDRTLVQETISDTTDPAWLQAALELGCVYLHKLDYDITKAALEAKKIPLSKGGQGDS